MKLKSKVLTGLENFIDDPPDYLADMNLGLLCNPASVNSKLVHTSKTINKLFPNKLKALFSPQHGFYADKQDNMIESNNSKERNLKIPIFSLYSKTRVATKEMFDLIDCLIIDLQDVGCRVYTFIYTISFCLEKAAEYNKKVIILDKPNPIGGIDVEGNLLENEFKSFVGRFPIPMRHGMTVGEIASFFNKTFNINCDLEIIKLKGWDRKMYFSDTDLDWILPSPNLPTPASCMVYPGQVIFEGTNISEGRGTTLPFEFFGAPYIDSYEIADKISNKIEGAYLRPVKFEPVAGKWNNQTCNGFQIHFINQETFKPYKTSLVLLQEIIRLYKNDFKFKSPPYEYEYNKLPMDLILGSKKLRLQIENMENIDKIEESWQKPLNNFNKISKKFYLYD
ncbi:MAG: DUF1343 domain-containing protein [Desulfobacteraceae bacterium]|nr:DUF1343 domain-containing protein [Desulfobacteraceae bacterium]